MKVQRKVRSVAGFSAAGSFLDRRNQGKFCGLSDAAGSPTFARRYLLKWYQLRIHGLAAQTRTLSGGDLADENGSYHEISNI
jgi:hypothetical protein